MNISTLPHQTLIHNKQPLLSLPPGSMGATCHVSASCVVPFPVEDFVNFSNVPSHPVPYVHAHKIHSMSYTLEPYIIANDLQHRM
jgi:hypothetical protein